ncbi:hypothetical protein SNEBB_002395 [Seison nebaliae]|nr:hypothetical protein SNEBB_002395 [Seison nebaliae]
MNDFEENRRRPSYTGESLYQTLGVTKLVTSTELKRAYHARAREHHPDKNPDNVAESTQKFQSINKAYHVLSNPEKRKFYDRYGSFGLNLLSVVGEENLPGLKFLLGPCCSCMIILCGLLSLCYCCCCCCFCCGKCIPKNPPDDMETDQIVTEQPSSHMAPDRQPIALYDAPPPN